MGGVIGLQLSIVLIPHGLAIPCPDKDHGRQRLQLGRRQGLAFHAHLVIPEGHFLLARIVLWYAAVAMLLFVFPQFAQTFIPSSQGLQSSFRSRTTK
jgi:hypothetical protein